MDTCTLAGVVAAANTLTWPAAIAVSVGFLSAAAVACVVAYLIWR